MRKTNILAAFFSATISLSCTNDLDLSIIDPQSPTTVDDMQVLAKVYAGLGVNGQSLTDDTDISMDTDESGFYRTTFNLMELPTDECLWAWQTDTDIPQLTSMAWNSSSTRVEWAYQRLAFNQTMCNYYIDLIADKTDADHNHYRAEARFLRALYYWYYLDLWHKAPFKNVYDIKLLPEEKAGSELYEWLDEELTAIESDLPVIGTMNSSDNFGRADQGAAYMLHARLALNSAVYTDGAINDYDKAIDYCNKIIESGKYELSSNAKNGYTGYEQLFMADNDENAQTIKEIILPIRQDGLYTKSQSAAGFLVESTRIEGMPYAGTSNCWSCYFAKSSLVNKFFANLSLCPLATESSASQSETDVIAQDEATSTTTKDVQAMANDDRALLYTGCGGGLRQLETDAITGFLCGASIVKFSNIRTDGAATHHQTFPDVDIPLLRYAEAFLTRAEAKWRKSGNLNDALDDINVLRRRANASELTSIDSESVILDEWCREFFFEGRRRSDLNRFGAFVGGKYLWPFKGGVAAGKSVDDYLKVYPIPKNEIDNNRNLTQNDNY